jgi:spore coat protein U-like protein
LKATKKFSALMIGSFALVASTGVALAESSDMEVSTTVANSCTISAGALSFAGYNSVAGTAVDGTATLTVACTKGSSATITLGQGENADTGSTDAVPLRRMVNGSNYLSYLLYSDSGRSTVWGNTAGTGAGYTAVTSEDSAVTVYGRITAGQDVPAATYTDTVTATITL